MPPSWIITPLAGPGDCTVGSIWLKRIARQVSETETPPRVPSCSVIGAAFSGLPRFSERKLSSSFCCAWRRIISSRVCAPPVAVRSTAGPSCAQAGLKISDASTRAAAPNRCLFIRVLQRNQQEGVVAEEVPELGELRNFVQISLCTFLLLGCAHPQAPEPKPRFTTRWR